MKIVVMGDLHYNFGALNRFISREKPDIILQCGDFGWWPHYHMVARISANHFFDQYAIKLDCTKLYWCDGNHENHDDLQERMKAAPGQPLEIPVPGCRYMPRGAVLTLPDGRNVLFFGGAQSIDKHDRVEGESWWPGEIPTQKDLDFARRQIKAHGGRVDIVISHTAPLLITMGVRGLAPERTADPTTFMLNQILEGYSPRQWFFGHFHKPLEGRTLGCHWRGLGTVGGSGWVVEI